MVHSLQDHHSKICHNEKTQAHYAHNPFHYYDCFATIPYLEETSLILMCSPSALPQDSPWVAANQNCESNQEKKRCGYPTLVMCIISNTENSNAAFQGLLEANRVSIHNCLLVLSKE